VNPDKLAKEDGCVEVSLEELGNNDYRFSEFKILPAENLGKSGDFIDYADLVYFKSALDHNCYLHVC